MIFITLGSQKFQFNRLLKSVDKLVKDGIIKDKIFAQTGYSDYEPTNYEYKPFLSREEFTKVIDETDIVITHGGTGAVVGALKANKKVIAIPRKKEYGEHVDNHQKQLIRQFEKNNLIYGLENCDELGEAIEYVKNHTFNFFQSNTGKIVESIKSYIEQI